MLYLDGLGASMFAIQATHKVMALNFGMPLAPILLGLTTAIGGGLIRDVLAGNTTLLMRHEIYAIPITVGCIAYAVLMTFYPQYAVLIGIFCMLLSFSIRAAAIYWDLSVPAVFLTRPGDGGKWVQPERPDHQRADADEGGAYLCEFDEQWLA
jgi:uncharacterized membrane protein YeiH